MNDEDSMVTMRPGAGPSLGRIDQYDLVRKLGGGGFGVVYLARDTNGGVEVAIKTLHPLLKHSPEEMEALRAKFALVSRLAHPNIATALVLHPVRDVNIWDDEARRELKLSPGDSVMVMRYAPGVTLSKWRRQFPDGVVPPDLALEIGRQLASALDYAHSEKIVHRDVKPSNVMVETLAAGPQGVEGLNVESQKSEDGTGPWTFDLGPSTRIRVRLLDFGLAAEIRSSMSRISTEQGDTSGTRPYMTPEQWLGRKQDGRTDQYALACVLYELLSGAPPFSGVFETGDPMIMMAAVKGETPEEIDDLPPAANAALLRALSKAPKERFPTCAAFVAALEGRDGSTSRPPDGRAVGASLPETAGADTSSVKDEAALLLRKAALQEALAAISDADRADKEFALLVKEATRAFRAAEDALKFGRIPAFASCLDRTDGALESLCRAKDRRKAEAERAARAEAERIRREREAATRAVAERERRREEEARLEAERQREEFDRVCADAKRKSESYRRKAWAVVGALFAVLLVSVFVGLLKSCTGSRETPETPETPEPPEPPMSESRRAAVVEQLVRNMVPIPGKDYRMGKYEVTQEEWEAVMGEKPWFFSGDRRPVEQVSWYDCQDFIRNLNALPAVKESGLTFRLPSEEEWETACRAGSTGAYCRLADGTEITASTLGRVAWFEDNSDDENHPVGQKEPNAFGLYDMHGNVWEWTGTADGGSRVFRGGGWNYSAWSCESSFRFRDSPGLRSFILGFRLCASGRAD